MPRRLDTSFENIAVCDTLLCMNTQQNESKKLKKRGKRMSRRNISIDDDLWTKAVSKAKYMSLSAVIRELLRMWVDDEIELK